MENKNTSEFNSLLVRNRHLFTSVLPFRLSLETCFSLDLGLENNALKNIPIDDVEYLNSYLTDQSAVNKGKIPIGGYAEKRILYSKSEHFGQGSEKRDIHLGLDIWVEAGTLVYAPLDSKVHSFGINNGYKDYGPTIILQHKIEDTYFHTLYGHLSSDSLDNLNIGKTILKGDIFARIGHNQENGHWPPHLHFQIIRNMGEWKGDYPGVSNERELSYYLNNCPDPAIFFGSEDI